MYVEMYILISLVIVSFIMAIGIVLVWFLGSRKLYEEYKYAEDMENGLNWMIMNAKFEVSEDTPEVIRTTYTVKTLWKKLEEERKRN